MVSGRWDHCIPLPCRGDCLVSRWVEITGGTGWRGLRDVLRWRLAVCGVRELLNYPCPGVSCREGGHQGAGRGGEWWEVWVACTWVSARVQTRGRESGVRGGVRRGWRSRFRSPENFLVLGPERWSPGWSPGWSLFGWLLADVGSSLYLLGLPVAACLLLLASACCRLAGVGGVGGGFYLQGGTLLAAP